MTRTYTTTLGLSIGGDTPTWEGEATVSYQMEWGSPESGCFGPPENYDPGSPSYPELVAVIAIDGRAPEPHEAETILGHIEANDALLAQLTEEATEAETADYDDAMERQAEERREWERGL